MIVKFSRISLLGRQLSVFIFSCKNFNVILVKPKMNYRVSLQTFGREMGIIQTPKIVGKFPENCGNWLLK